MSLKLPRSSLRRCMNSLPTPIPINSLLLSLSSKTHLQRHLRHMLRVLRMLGSLWMLLWPDTMSFSNHATRKGSLVVPRANHICIRSTALVGSHGVTRTSIWSFPPVFRTRKTNTVLRCHYHSKPDVLKSPKGISCSNFGITAISPCKPVISSHLKSKNQIFPKRSCGTSKEQRCPLSQLLKYPTRAA